MKKLILICALALAACGEKPTPPEAPKAAAQFGNIEISQMRVRLPPNGTETTAAYFTIKNNGDKEIKIKSGSADIAGSVELHAHFKDDTGMMQMRQIMEVAIPAHETIVLQPGGLHLMLFKVKNDLSLGQMANITLNFDDNTTANFTAPIVANPALPKAEHGDMKHEGHEGN